MIPPRPLEHPPASDIKLTDVLAALGDPVRLAIVVRLSRAKGEIGWGEFDFAVNKATLSHHMRVLRLAGLIRHRKEGTRCFVSLRRDLEKRYLSLVRAVVGAESKSASLALTR